MDVDGGQRVKATCVPTAISVEPVASSNRIKTQRKCSKRAWRKGRAEFLMVPPEPHSRDHNLNSQPPQRMRDEWHMSENNNNSNLNAQLGKVREA